MVDVADSKLSQIKGWKIPSSDSSLSSQQQRDDSTTERHRRKASQSDKSNKTSDIESVTVQSNGFCRFVTLSFFRSIFKFIKHTFTILYQRFSTYGLHTFAVTFRMFRWDKTLRCAKEVLRTFDLDRYGTGLKKVAILFI